MSEPVSGLCQNLHYTFNHLKLLEAALTHRSAGSANNERLEFLGDAILNFVIAAELYRRFPLASEGELSRLRATLVRGEALAELACALNIGAYLSLGQGELKSGGALRASTLADALEAIIGAIYLDGGFVACETVVRSFYQNRFDSISPTTDLKDPKTRLQEYLQARKMAPPLYRVLIVNGNPHAQTFRVECAVEGSYITYGEGSSRRRAEQQAAYKALELIGI